jgi:hypothetical protein
MLMLTAQHYDLTTDEGRAQSNKDLIELFMHLNRRYEPEVTYEIGAFNARFSVEIKKACRRFAQSLSRLAPTTTPSLRAMRTLRRGLNTCLRALGSYRGSRVSCSEEIARRGRRCRPR